MALKANPVRLRVHQVAVGIVAEVAQLARGLRGPGTLAHGDQLVRSAISISANIAEACGRDTQRDFQRFVSIARGSAQELLTHVRLARPRGSGLTATRHLEARTALVIKMLDRLHRNPPPIR